MTIKYYDKYDPFRQIQNQSTDFEILQEPRNEKYRLANTRDGQSEFKGKILRAYNNCCCVTGETIPELLEAAHIQDYKNRQSNHVQNGLLLRVDIHRLFDNGLIFIDKNYIIHISNQITTQHYRQFHGRTITLPLLINDRPSTTALELRREEFRN